MSPASEKTQAYLCWLKERGEINFFLRKNPSEDSVPNISAKPIPSTHSTPNLPATTHLINSLANKNIAKKIQVLVVGDGPSTQNENLEDLLPIKEKQILLNLLNSIGLRREDFHVINISENLDDHQNTRQLKEKFFLSQIRLFDPKIILGLGQKVTVLRSELSFNIKDHHGICKNIYFGEKSISVLPIFSPLYPSSCTSSKKSRMARCSIFNRFFKEE